MNINEKINIFFGKWSSQLDYIDDNFNKLATRLIKFVKEIGQDPYNRFFNVEPLLDFAIDTNITDKDINYIYRHYVYNLIAKYEVIDIEKEEAKYYLL